MTLLSQLLRKCMFQLLSMSEVQVKVTNTLSSVTGSGNVKYKKNSLACEIHADPACKIYLLLSFTLIFSPVYLNATESDGGSIGSSPSPSLQTLCH